MKGVCEEGKGCCRGGWLTVAFNGRRRCLQAACKQQLCQAPAQREVPAHMLQGEGLVGGCCRPSCRCL